ncbi:hypothetical protein AGMMS49928_08010 [Spirochaetia bacterium]|nr:hypothetical protein AGMMS49928_08010 [Spirochaetia bacterium]
MKAKNFSKAAFWGGIAVLFLILASCKSSPPPEDDVFALINQKQGAKAQELFWGKATINDRDDRGRTTLIAAAESEDDALVAFLIALGADVNALDKQGRSALTVAVERNDISTAKILSKEGADIHHHLSRGSSPALFALTDDKSGQEVLDAILTPGSVKSVDENGRTIFHLAVQEGNISAVKKILAVNDTVLSAKDNEDKTGLDIALEETDSSDHAEIAEDLILRGAKIESPFYHVFSQAVLKADYNFRFADGSTILHYCAREGYSGYVEFLLERKADINTLDVAGTPPPP